MSELKYFLYMTATFGINYIPEALTVAGYTPPPLATIEAIAKAEGCTIEEGEGGHLMRTPPDQQMFEARSTTHRVGLKLLEAMGLGYKPLTDCMTVYRVDKIIGGKNAKV